MAEGDSFGPDRYFDTGVHVPRYDESIEWLKPWLRYEGPMIVPPSPNLPMCRKLLEVGGCGVWTRMLTAAMPWVSVDGTQGDIRLGWDATPEFDAVAFMEVMEHLWDVDPAPGEWPDEFKGTGMRNVLRSIYGSLKPGGVMLLTTPNAGSCNAIWDAMAGGAGVTFRPHFREYSCGEVRWFVEEAGFRVVRHETLEIWQKWGSRELYARVLAVLRHLGVSDQMRGEDQFMIAQKPVDA